MAKDKLQEKRRKKAATLSKPTPVELPSGRWRCQVMVNGQRVSVIEDDPETAHAKAVALREGVIKQESKPGQLTVGQAIDRYIDSKDAVLSPSTIRGYRKIRRTALQELMDIKLPVLTQEAVQKSINQMARGNSPKSVRNAHGLLSVALSVYAPDMVLKTTLPQKKRHEINIPTTEEIGLIADAAKGSKFELPFLLAAWMGLRTSEIRALTWDCVEDGFLHIKQAIVYGDNGPVVKSTKTYSGDRRIKIPDYIMELLQNQKKENDYILKIYHNQLYDTLSIYCKKLGIPHYRFHDLRHYHASVMLALGVPDKYAMERMGHASTNMLKNVYQHTMKNKSESVAEEIDKFFCSNLHTDLHTDK